MEAIKIRHSVRNYTDQKIEGEVLAQLRDEMDQCNRESGLHIQLCTEEPDAFNSLMAHYGKFRNVNNYIAIVGSKKDKLNETCGYYGEKVVLKATQLGLQTCWVVSTFSKGKCACKVAEGEKIYCVIAIGYGTTMGVQHKSKDLHSLCSTDVEMPDWFKKGMDAAILAPTAINQQKFQFILKDGKVNAVAGKAFYATMDLGIVKYHFEVGSGYTFPK
jgi:nitroreductase